MVEDGGDPSGPVGMSGSMTVAVSSTTEAGAERGGAGGQVCFWGGVGRCRQGHHLLPQFTPHCPYAAATGAANGRGAGCVEAGPPSHGSPD